jgi:hypothetical protein
MPCPVNGIAMAQNPRLSAFKIDLLVFQTTDTSGFSSAFVLPPSPRRFSRNLVKSAPSRAFGETKRSIADFGDGHAREGMRYQV